MGPIDPRLVQIEFDLPAEIFNNFQWIEEGGIFPQTTVDRLREQFFTAQIIVAARPLYVESLTRALCGLIDWRTILQTHKAEGPSRFFIEI